MTILRARHAWLAAASLFAVASVGLAQSPAQPAIVPDFRIEIQGFAEADFHSLIWQYAELRRELAVGLPPLVVTSNPADIWVAEHALARRIRGVRGSTQGTLFTPAVSTEFRRVLLLLLTPETLAIIMDDNPGEFRHYINGDYPKNRTWSSVPSTILFALPELPADIQYRFLGRILILHDTRANIILDRLTCALECE